MKAARAFFKRPWIIIAVCVILTGLLGFFVTSLGIDNSIRQFLPQKDASYTRLTETEDQFGSMIVIGVSLESTNGTVLTPENIEVTDLDCEQQTFVPGVKSLDTMEFEANYDKEIYSTLTANEKKDGYFELEFGTDGADGVFEWEGMYTLSVLGGGTNEARKMKIVVTPSTDIKLQSA